MSNEEANRLMEEAQDKLLEAYEAYEAFNKAIAESIQVFNGATAISANKNCDQYKEIVKRFNEGYEGLCTVREELWSAFRDHTIARAIEVAKSRRQSN